MKTLIFALAILCHPGPDCDKDNPNTYSIHAIGPECTNPYDCYFKARDLVTNSPGLRGEPGSWWLFSTLKADRD